MIKSKKILVFGGNGFIGKNLCTFLANQNYEVISFDVNVPIKKSSKIKYVIGNFFDENDMNSALENVDVVIHSISTVNPGNSNSKYLQGYKRDFIQSINLFEKIKNKNIKLIFLSSGGTVYGIQKHQPINENQLPLPINHYGAIKLCIENVIRTFNKQMNTKMIIARVSNPYGPGQDYHKGVGFVDAVLKKTMNHEVVEIWGDGKTIRDYIYIEDVCKYVCSLIVYEGHEEVFNISSSEGICLNDIVKYIEKVGLKPQVVYKNARSVDVERIVLDNAKILKVENNDKPIRLKDGIRKYYEYLKLQKGK